MTLMRKICILSLVGTVGLVAAEATTEIAGTPGFDLIPAAHAVVGRPLTPVSVAGVARRTGRRCATGVYNC